MRFAKSLLLGLTSVPLALLSTTGCVEEQPSLYVERALLVTEDECLVEVDLPSYSSGTLDIAVDAARYTLPLSLVNQLRRTANANQLRAETNVVLLDGAEVNVTGPSTLSFTEVFAGSVDPGSGDTPGRTPVIVDVVPPGADIEPGNYVIQVEIFGHTLGGTPVEAATFSWPLRVCDGCLFTCNRDQGPVCVFQTGADVPHSCQFYGPGGCDDCPDE